jgi:O-antigen/teichoic acid export membrane protein
MIGQEEGDASIASSELPSRFARNAVSNYALTAVLMLVALITTPILTQHLGTERFGIWIVVGSTITYVQLLDLGFGGAVVSAVARLSAADDEDGLERTLTSSFFLLLGLGLVALLVTVVAAQFLPDAFHLRPPLAGTARDLLLLLGLDIAVSIPMDTFGCGLVALQRYDLLNATLIGVALGQATAWTLVLVYGGGLLPLGIVTVAISLVGQAARYLLLRRLLPGLAISPSRVDRTLVRSLVSPALWYSLGDAIDGFRDNASVLLLGVVQNAAAAGIFAVGEKVATLGTQLGNPLTDPFFPHAATLVGRGDRAKLGEAAHTGTRLSAGVTIPCCLVVALFARPALMAWVGPSYLRAVPALVILAVTFGLRSLSAAPFKILSGSGGQKLIALMSVAEIATQITLTVVLGLYFGITGVAVAVLASVVCVEFAVALPLVAARLGTRLVQLVLPVIKTHLPALAVAGALGWFVSRGPVLSFATSHGRVPSMAVVALAGLAVLLAYLVVFAMTGLTNDTRRRALSRLREIRHHGLSGILPRRAWTVPSARVGRDPATHSHARSEDGPLWLARDVTEGGRFVLLPASGFGLRASVEMGRGELGGVDSSSESARRVARAAENGSHPVPTSAKGESSASVGGGVAK